MGINGLCSKSVSIPTNHKPVCKKLPKRNIHLRPYLAALIRGYLRKSSSIQGIGDLFDIRIAGNIVIPEAVGSIEYATALLGTPLIMVLGHERCGAVTAAVKGESLPSQIGTFVKAIKPAMAKVKDKPGDPVENAVVANVKYQVERLQENSALLVQLMEAGKLKIVGGRYDLDTGEVTII